MVSPPPWSSSPSLGFLAVPPILKGYLARTLTRELHRPVAIRAVRFNPFTLTATVAGCEVKDRDGISPFISFASLRINLSSWSLPERAPVVSALVLRGLRLNLVRNRDGTYNFSDLLKSGSGKPLRYSLNNIEILDSSVVFDDRPTGTRHEVTRLRIALPFLSNLPRKVNVYLTPALTALVDGRVVDIHGEGRPFSARHVSRVSFDVSHLDLARYLPYLPADLGFRVVSGNLGTHVGFIFLQDGSGRSKIILSGDATLQDLVIDQQDGRPLARLPRIDVAVGAWDLLSGQGVVQRITAFAPEVYVRRDKRGAINLAGLGSSGAGASKPDAGKTAPGIDLLLGEISASGGTVHVEDEAVRPAFRTTLSPFDLTVRGLTTALSQPATEALVLTTAQGEVVRQAGSVAFSPLRAEGRIQATGVRLARYAPYDRDLLPFVVEDGKLDFSGHYVFDAAKGRNEVRLSEATAGASGLRLRLAGEKADFLEASSATVSGLSLDTAAGTASIGSLEVAGGHLRAIRSADGTLDLARLAAPGEPEGAPETQHARSSAASPPWQVTLHALKAEGLLREGGRPFLVRARDL